ncbi:sulfatase-like hydrolase/transferase [Reichenbachiella versicolor]|uniref:sulfatase-like hydrolase/transferase n=1 Tax=Reichenbachiella versicolor TaxID=1821036 RepID=UPI001C86FC97|nr:sulfatase-like hydrolase/transferase [Reichenbachiella versicolor]
MRLFILVCLGLFLFKDGALAKQNKQQPNILWIVTDDHRYDAVRAFNKMLHGREMSELGYVESPNIDKLTEMGTTFVNSYCHSAVCAPSRAAMHYGRYPFRTGVYAFEYHNNNLDHCKPTLPEQMADLGYQTFHVGKLGVRIKTITAEGKTKAHPIYQNDVSFKQMAKDGMTDWGKDWFRTFEGEKLEKPIKNLVFFVSPDGTFEYNSTELERQKPEFAGMSEEVLKKYDLLRIYNEKKGKHLDKGMILAGVSSQPAGKTRDGYYNKVLIDYLNNTDPKFKVGSQTVNGLEADKPLFVHLGYDFPHTPVIPPKSYRDRFQKYKYDVPEFDEKELELMPRQIQGYRKQAETDHFSDEEKQKMVQDYYAFCAYGDDLIGKSTEAFIKYSEDRNQPWTIVYVNGDHGWKLNDKGAVSKCTPWDVDTHNPIVIVSSDKKKFPPGKVVKDYTEFVDIAPTILADGGANLKSKQFAYLDGMDMAEVAAGKAPIRDYIIGESHAATGPRAFIRTKEFVFSMQTRPWKKNQENLDWARKANLDQIDPALYDMVNDPKETNNLAFDKKYKAITEAMREKLTNIIFDERVEVDWEKWGSGTKSYKSKNIPDAHDYKLDLPGVM